uniref:Uncharacterized protein n=1 Tax=Pseudobryopsis hainanensis TaxID=2320808 RepID=A0A3S5X140_9CHLO|nr:hypothetical protein [Pseudobryopsis hainanensis]
MIIEAQGTRLTQWSEIDWTVVVGTVTKLRSLIYKAKQKGNTKQLRRWQDVILRSHANILVSVRENVLTNKHRTPSCFESKTLQKQYDKTHLWVSSDLQSWHLYQEFVQLKRENWKSIANIKRTKTKEKLDSVLLKDRIIQSMVKNALEPEWKAVFINSPRSAQEALFQLKNSAQRLKRLWVLRAPLKGCLNKANFDFLINQISSFPAREVIKIWLQRGYCQFPPLEFDKTTKTMPETSMSFLLANIAFQGLEIERASRSPQGFGQWDETIQKSQRCKSNETTSIGQQYQTIRYGDELVVLTNSYENCIKARTLLKMSLKNRGLKFDCENTNIAHLSQGIQFLGCQIKLYERASRSPQGFGQPNNLTLRLTPHPEQVMALKIYLKGLWLRNKATTPSVIIKKLNPIIRKWSNYYRPFSSLKSFKTLDHWMWHRCWRYAKRRHPKKSKQWIYQKYFGQAPGSKNRWRFCVENHMGKKIFLKRFSQVGDV